MKAQITEYGTLVIDRGRGSTATLCPFTKNDDVECGDWCPHFGEPVETSILNPEHLVGDTDIPALITVYEITICHGRKLVFDSLKDYRLLK